MGCHDSWKYCVCISKDNLNLQAMVYFSDHGESLDKSHNPDTFDFVIPLLCVTVFWNGVLYVAREAGIIHFVERLMHPLLKWLFPDLKHDEETLGYVATMSLLIW